jgi:salicylate hydroxylase
MTSDPQGLNVAIIGGGLAGALTARVLREAHRVTIYERAKDVREPGAAIAISPNGVKILDALGFDRNRAGSLAVGPIKIYDHKGDIVQEKQQILREMYGADQLAHHRSDLRNEFLRLATADSEELGIKGQPARIAWGCEVTAVDAEAGKITLSTGKEVHADLIVGEMPLWSLGY